VWIEVRKAGITPRSLFALFDRPEEIAYEKSGQYALFYVFRALPDPGDGGK
jgi:hypothetical protein